jgi:integrase
VSPYEKHILLSDPEKIKNGKPRTVPLTARAYDILWKRKRAGYDDPFGFTNQRVDDMIKEFRKVHDFDCRLLHTCRHTFCSRLVQSGVPLAVVKELAGHSDLQTTLRYAHLTSENLSDAIKTMEAQGG